MRPSLLLIPLTALCIGTLGLQPTPAQIPNSPADLSEPGWTAWRPRPDPTEAQFLAGFSNSEMGGFLDFQAACQQSTGLENEAIDYWFRLSRLVQAIGTGQVEYGCWQAGEFRSTIRNTAVRTDLDWVDCLKVTANAPNGLVIRAEFSRKSARVGTVRMGGRVTPNSFPAVILNADGRDWIAISGPREGWVSVGESPDGPINLTLCNP